MTVTLSTDTEVDVDIGLVWQDPSATTLSNTNTPPSELDLSLLNIRGVSFIFLDGATPIGSMRGAFRAP